MTEEVARVQECNNLIRVVETQHKSANKYTLLIQTKNQANTLPVTRHDLSGAAVSSQKGSCDTQLPTLLPTLGFSRLFLTPQIEISCKRFSYILDLQSNVTTQLKTIPNDN